MGAACSSCSGVVPKYQQHVLSLYPDPHSPEEVATLGGVLQQDEVHKWKVRGSTGDLCSYLHQFPQKLAPTGAFLSKRIRLDLERGRLRHAAIGTCILRDIVEQCHQKERLALYEAYVCAVMDTLFREQHPELHILAVQCLVALLKAQADTNTRATGAGAGGGSGAGNGDATFVSSYTSTLDYAKYAMFYPPVLAMATRNPPRSPLSLSSMAQQAKGLFLDAKEKEKLDQQRMAEKKRRVKDLAELEANTQADKQEGKANEDEAKVAAPSSSSSSSPSDVDTSSSTLKLHISLWRSRYFGLKGLGHLLALNRDWKQSVAHLDEILPALLVNLPKNKRSIKQVAREVNKGEAINQVDEVYKPWEEKDKDKDKEKEKGGEEKKQNKGERRLSAAASFLRGSSSKDKEVDLASKTGITLHHVQLLAYDAFLSLCKLPTLTLHLPSLLQPLFAWMDQHQRTMIKTSLSGTPVEPTNLQTPAAASTAASKKDSKYSASEPSSATPYAWENLYFTSHLFVELICKHVVFENGSIDALILPLMQHLDEVEEKQLLKAASNSRRASKQEEGLLTPSSHQPEPAVGGGANLDVPVSTPAGGAKASSLAQDFKQLFHKRRHSAQRMAPTARSAKMAQVAIVHLINSILIQADVPAGLEEGAEGDEATDGAASFSSISPTLCLMNSQILLDQYVSLVLAAVRSVEQAERNRDNRAHAEGAADPEVLDMERRLQSQVDNAHTYLSLLTRISPSLLIQKFYSYNDILQSVILVLQLATSYSAQKPNKRALMEAAYSMSLGLLKWGSADDEIDPQHRRAPSSPLSPLTEEQNEEVGLGVAAARGRCGGKTHASMLRRISIGGGQGRGGFGGATDSNLSSLSHYETLIHAVLGGIACESDVNIRGLGYKTLQSVLMCMSGFGGGWSALSSAASALSLHSNAAVAAYSGFNFANLNTLAMVGLTRSHTSGGENGGGSLANAGGSSTNLSSMASGSFNEEMKPTINPATLTLDMAADDKSSSGDHLFDPTPSPNSLRHSVSAGTSASTTHGSTSKLDLRALRIPQIFASCMDIKSRIHAPTSALTSALDDHTSSRLVAGGGGSVVAPVSLQDQRWILSLIWYEITSCFSEGGVGAQEMGGASASATPNELSVDASAPKGSPSVAPNDPTPHQLASTILKPRGRGATSNENIILCFQLLILLLQRQPGQRVASEEEEGTGASLSSTSEFVGLQQSLSVQFPFLLRLMSYVRSESSDDKFHLVLSQKLKLYTFILTYFFFISKLLTSSMDSLWVRQTCLGLEEMLQATLAARQAHQEGMGCELESSWLFGLVESHTAKSEQQQPTDISTPIDPEQLATLLAKLLMDPTHGDRQNASGSNVASPHHADGGAATPAALHDPALDDSLEAEMAEQKAYLLDSDSFDPFSLKYLLPEQPQRFGMRGMGLGMGEERENSVSWAPSNLLGGAAGTAVSGGEADQFDQAPLTARAGSFFGSSDPREDSTGSAGQATPGQQHSPALRSKTMPVSSPLGGLGGFHLPSTTQQGMNGSVSNSTLVAVPQSPVAPQSEAEMLAEMDQQSFMSLANSCTRTTVRSQEEFAQFMSQLESNAPPAVARTSVHRRRSSGSRTFGVQQTSAPITPQLTALAAASAPPSSSLSSSLPPSAATTSAHPPSLFDKGNVAPSSLPVDASAGTPLYETVEDVSSYPDFKLIRTHSTSTLEQHFPPLASFDMYLHSEIE